MPVMPWSPRFLRTLSTITMESTTRRRPLRSLDFICSYVNNLNNLLPEGGAPLEELIKTATGGVFNNAAQVWNHTFYWNCMTPNKTELKGELKAAIEAKWGSVEQFMEEFSKVTIAHFGSGWSWLVKNEDGSLEILSTGNAANPLRGRC